MKLSNTINLVPFNNQNCDMLILDGSGRSMLSFGEVSLFPIAIWQAVWEICECEILVTPRFWNLIISIANSYSSSLKSSSPAKYYANL